MDDHKQNHFIKCLEKLQENKPKYVFKTPKEKELFDKYCESFDNNHYEQPKKQTEYYTTSSGKQIRKLNPSYVFYKYLQVCGIECNPQEIMDIFDSHKSHISTDDEWLKLFESPDGQSFLGKEFSLKAIKEIKAKLNN